MPILTKTATSGGVVFSNMAECDWSSGHPIRKEGGAVTGKTEGAREHNRKQSAMATDMARNKFT